MASKLYQVFTGVPNQKYCLIKARIVAKNGQLSDWTAWHYALAGDSTAPVVPTGAEVDFTAPIGAMFFRLTDAYIAAMDADVVRFRWYVQSRSGSGALAFDSAWTPTAVLDRDNYTFAYSVVYAAATYYHIWCVPEDVMGNWDSTPGAAQEQNKQPGTAATTDLPVSSLGWTYGGAFTASDLDTVAWAAGSLVLADGNTYSITGSNTGTMAAVTYVYWDKDILTTAFQVTTAAATSVGANKLLIAVGQNVAAGKLAVFQAFNAKGGGVLITADNITAATITGNEVAANTIAAGNIVGGTITTSLLNFTPLISSGGTGAIVATINASAEGIEIEADNFTVTGATVFTKKVAGTYDSAASGARVRIFPDANTGIQIIDDGGADVFKVLVGGTDVGDVIIGSAAGQYLKWDKSAGQVLAKIESLIVSATNNYAKMYASGSYASVNIGNDSTNAVCSMGCTLIGTQLFGGIVAHSRKTDNGLYDSYVLLQGEAPGNNCPEIELHINPGTHSAYINLNSSGLLSILTSGDILIDPDGGDVDFDACDIWLDSGKHLSLNGSTDSIYITYDSVNTEILCSARVNATGGFADNGTDGIDWTGNPNSLTSMTFLGGILTATA